MLYFENDFTLLIVTYLANIYAHHRNLHFALHVSILIDGVVAFTLFAASYMKSLYIICMHSLYMGKNDSNGNWVKTQPVTSTATMILVSEHNWTLLNILVRE